MSNAALTSILTRCLLDAAFLEHVETDRETALAPYRLSAEERTEFDSFDPERVGRFSGFITKVKHNDLWERFPYTRLLMRRLGLELEVFTAYRREYQRLLAEGPRERPSRIARFFDFLGRYLEEQGGPGTAALADVACHERFSWEIHHELAARQDAAAEGTAPALEGRSPGELVPCPRGALRVGQFTHHPLDLVAAIRDRRFEVQRLEPRRRWLAYLVEEGPEGEGRELEILELDSSAAALLSALDGRRSLGEIFAAALPGEAADVREAAARSFLDSLLELGFFRFGVRGATTRCDG